MPVIRFHTEDGRSKQTESKGAWQMFVDTPLRSYKGYCRHGAYVGGIGIDWMCGYCESGITELWKCDCGKSEWFDTRNPVKCIANPERSDRARSIMRMRSDLRKMVDLFPTLNFDLTEVKSYLHTEKQDSGYSSKNMFKKKPLMEYYTPSMLLELYESDIWHDDYILHNWGPTPESKY